MQIGADLIQIAPDFAVLSAVTCIQHTDNFPLAATERDLFSDARVGKSMSNGFSNHQFPASGLEPAAFRNPEALPHRDAGRRDAADRHIHAVRRIYARQVDFERCHGIPIPAASDARLELEILKLSAGKIAD